MFDTSVNGVTVMMDYYTKRDLYNKAVMRERRRVVRRQKFCVLAAAIVIVLAFSVFTGARFTFANQNQSSPAKVKCYKSIIIYCGDTLTSIADEYCSDEWKDRASYIHEVESINHLDEDTVLIAGNYLCVPYYREIASE